MIRFFVKLILLQFISIVAVAQAKEYKLLDKTPAADINFKAILLMEARPGTTLLEKGFKPVKGRYTVYRFMAAYRGLSFTNTSRTFHDVIIVRTGPGNEIVSAFQYTLEWAELPLISDLYQSTCTRTSLSNDMKVSDFKFVKIARDDKKCKNLKDTGCIKLRQ